MNQTDKQQGQQNGVNGIQRVEVVQHEASDIDILAVIERRNEMLSRILKYAISATHAGQWVNQDGKPYPTAPAAEVMARRCAVRISEVQTTKEPSSDDKGPFYLYICTSTASLPGGFDSIQAIGTCSSRDQFLGTETRAGRRLSEIDEGNILKAAYSNMMVNAVTRLLGVRNLTWEQLADLGINRDGAAKVEHRSGSRGGGETAHKDGAPVIPYGKNKGTPITEIDDGDLDWHLKRAQEDVAKNDPKWHDKNQKWLATLQAELARRANGKAGTAPAPEQASVWTRVVALLQAAGVQNMGPFVKGCTGKDHSSKLTEDDIPKVQAAIAAAKQPEGVSL